MYKVGERKGGGGGEERERRNEQFGGSEKGHDHFAFEHESEFVFFFPPSPSTTRLKKKKETGTHMRHDTVTCDRALHEAFKQCGGVPSPGDERAHECLRSHGVVVDGTCTAPCRLAGDSRSFCASRASDAGVVHGTHLYGGPSRVVQDPHATTEKAPTKRSS